MINKIVRNFPNVNDIFNIENFESLTEYEVFLHVKKFVILIVESHQIVDRKDYATLTYFLFDLKNRNVITRDEFLECLYHFYCYKHCLSKYIRTETKTIAGCINAYCNLFVEVDESNIDIDIKNELKNKLISGLQYNAYLDYTGSGEAFVFHAIAFMVFYSMLEDYPHLNSPNTDFLKRNTLNYNEIVARIRQLIINKGDDFYSSKNSPLWFMENEDIEIFVSFLESIEDEDEKVSLQIQNTINNIKNAFL